MPREVFDKLNFYSCFLKSLEMKTQNEHVSHMAPDFKAPALKSCDHIRETKLQANARPWKPGGGVEEGPWITLAKEQQWLPLTVSIDVNSHKHIFSDPLS